MQITSFSHEAGLCDIASIQRGICAANSAPAHFFQESVCLNPRNPVRARETSLAFETPAAKALWRNHCRAGEGERPCFERIDVELIGTAPFRCQPCRKADLICIVRKGKLLGYNRAACFKLHGKAGAALPAAMRCGMCAKGTASIKRKRTRHQPVAHFTLCGER